MTRYLPRNLARWRTTLAAVAIVSAATSAFPAFAQSLVIARDMDINSLDIHRSWCDTCVIYNSAVYESLLTLDKDNKLQPVLAESWTASDDQTKFTFKLNPKATFSDGSKVEAKDVKWSWERLKNLKGNASGLAESLKSVEAPDAETVVATTTGPNSEFLNLVAASYLGIVNSDVAEQEGKAMGGEDAAQSDNSETWFLSHSAGAGPFVLSSYEPGSELRLKKNDKYWRDPAKIDEVIFRQVGDAVAQAQLLQSGQADIAMQIDPETAKTLTQPNVKTESTPSYNFVYLALGPGASANQVPLTAEVREAISIAIDRQSLLDFTVGEGNGQLISVPFPLGFPGGADHPIPEYNPEKAKELLAKAGHPDGFSMEAMYPQVNVYGVDFGLMFQKVQQDLAKVNVKLDLKPTEFATWRERVNSDHIPITAVYFAPDFYGTSQYVQTFGLAEGTMWAKRAGGEKDKSFLLKDTLTKMADALKSDPAAAEKIWYDIGEEIRGANIILPMLSPNIILAYGDKVKGVRNSACCNLPLYEVSVGE